VSRAVDQPPKSLLAFNAVEDYFRCVRQRRLPGEPPRRTVAQHVVFAGRATHEILRAGRCASRQRSDVVDLPAVGSRRPEPSSVDARGVNRRGANLPLLRIPADDLNTGRSRCVGFVHFVLALDEALIGEPMDVGVGYDIAGLGLPLTDKPAEV